MISFPRSAPSASRPRCALPSHRFLLSLERTATTNGLVCAACAAQKVHCTEQRVQASEQFCTRQAPAVRTSNQQQQQQRQRCLRAHPKARSPASGALRRSAGKQVCRDGARSSRSLRKTYQQRRKPVNSSRLWRHHRPRAQLNSSLRPFRCSETRAYFRPHSGSTQ